MEAVDKVNALIKDFLAPYADVNIVCSSDFYYDDESNEIGWSFLSNERQDRTFCDFFENTLHCPICNTFIYSIFHEFGHKMTYNSFSGVDWMVYRLQVDDIECISEDKEEREYIYYNLPIERAASEWAVNFITEHLEEIKDWFDNYFVDAANKIFEDEELSMYISELIN